MFVDREAELTRLTGAFGRGSADLVVIYGRRRLGKTELVRESIRGRDDAVYYLATQTEPALQLEAFLEIAIETYPELEGIRRDFEHALTALADEDAIVVLDEFPYLIESDSSIPSVIQRAWDTHIQETRATLILVGSSIGMIETHVLAGDSPLHGRATERLDIAPLAPGDAWEFYPDYDVEDAVIAWAIFGGTPHYLRAIDPDRSLGHNVHETLLSPQGLLHEEPEFILRTELEQPRTYFSLLHAMARGKRTPNEIKQAAGAESRNIGTYLNTLERLRIIARDVPVTEQPTRSQRGRYRLTDPLFRFWFRFVYGQASRIELLGDAAYEQLVEAELSHYVAPLFEELCRRALPTLVPEPSYRAIGGWWFREHELDVVGLTDGATLVVGECKFGTRPVGTGVLRTLESTTDHVDWTPPVGGNPTEQYVVFSRSGFTDELAEVASERNDVSLFGLPDVVGALTDAD